MNEENAAPRRKPTLRMTSIAGVAAMTEVSEQLNALLADLFALHMKTKNFHWHVSGPNFRGYHALFDEQAMQLYSATDAIAERVRKIGVHTLHSIGDVSRRQRLSDNDAELVTPADMLIELLDDNQQLVEYLRETHAVCEEHGDIAGAGLVETFIEEAERRVWQLFEMSRPS